MVYEKTEEESIIQFDQDLDQYMRDEMSASDRMWLKLVLMQNWEACLQRDVDEENKEQANAVAGLIKGQTKIMLQMERIIENAAKMERLVSNQQ